MPSRTAEVPKVRKLQLGQPYSRAELVDLLEVAPLLDSREWTGIVAFNNCVLLFVTLDKEGKVKRHQYRDQFDGTLLYWDSQATNLKTSPVIGRLTSGSEDVRLFVRAQEKIQGKVQPFYYCGRLTYLDSYRERPVRFHWRLVDLHGENLDLPGIRELLSWRPYTAGLETTGGNEESGRESGDTKTNLFEGSKTTATVNRYERDPRGREECIKAHGAQCWVCGFDFGKAFGALGDGFIFVHHRIPVPERAKQGRYELDPVEDLVPVCGNCHAMVHRGGTSTVTTGAILQGNQSVRLSELRKQALCEPWEQTN